MSQVECFSVEEWSWINAEVFSITTERVQDRRDRDRKQSISHRRLILESRRKYIVLAHRRFSIAEIELHINTRTLTMLCGARK
jgi:hypothetical protein